MYVSHPTCVPPSDPDTPIWRYVDLAKFLDLLENKHLHFARLDQLGDPFEGAISKRAIGRWLGLLNPIGVPNPDDYHGAVFRSTYDFLRHWSFVNCWHINEHESAAMWKLYGDRGIALRSTFQKLCDSVNASTEHEVFVGQVTYRDYVIDDMTIDNTLHAVMSKRRSFEHERELRAVVLRLPEVLTDDGNGVIKLFGPNHPRGIYVPCDLTALLDKVYVSPGSPKWFRDLIGDVIKRYDLNHLPIEVSSLDQRPDYL